MGLRTRALEQTEPGSCNDSVSYSFREHQYHRGETDSDRIRHQIINGSLPALNRPLEHFGPETEDQGRSGCDWKRIGQWPGTTLQAASQQDGQDSIARRMGPINKTPWHKPDQLSGKTDSRHDCRAEIEQPYVAQHNNSESHDHPPVLEGKIQESKEVNLLGIRRGRSGSLAIPCALKAPIIIKLRLFISRNK